MTQLDIFPKTKKRCDGKIHVWAPEWEAYEADSCACCRQDCEGCVTETAYRDVAEPLFHLGGLKRLPKDKIKCLACEEEWLDFSGMIKKSYSAKEFELFTNTPSPFLSALEGCSLGRK
jgi:hypothetical protein